MKRKVKYISFIMISILMLLAIKSNAAMAIKPNATIWTNINVSDSYSQCYNLRNADSTLGSNQLDPHLTLNKDWGAVAYLAISSYGAVTDSEGPYSNNYYYTTTGNATGVINMGYKYTQTASVPGGGFNGGSSMSNLTNNMETKYVEKLSSSNTSANTLGQALAETSGWWKSSKNYSKADYPILGRSKILGYGHLNGYASWASGTGDSEVTFRPVIWNIK